MKNKPLPDKRIEAAPRTVIPTQLIYTALAIVFVLGALQPVDWVLRLEYGAAALFCLWLIHCRRHALCVCRDRDMVVTVAPRKFTEMLASGIGRYRYVIVPYSVVAGVSENWRELLLVDNEGIMTVVPVDWNEMRPQDKGHILLRLERDRTRSDD